jgi:hypothetical protein
MYDNPSTLKEQQAKIFAQFIFDYGHELLCASLRDQPNLDKFDQVMHNSLLFSAQRTATSQRFWMLLTGHISVRMMQPQTTQLM